MTYETTTHETATPTGLATMALLGRGYGGLTAAELLRVAQAMRQGTAEETATTPNRTPPRPSAAIAKLAGVEDRRRRAELDAVERRL